MMNKITLLPLIVVIIQGCATAYQPDGFNGGYSETQLDAKKYEVTFRGNRFTEIEKANDFALLRCAELAIENGFNYFEVVNNYQYCDYSYQHYPKAIYSTSIPSGNKNVRVTFTTGDHTYDISKPRLSYEIIFHDNDSINLYYNATLTKDSIINKYKLN